MFWNEKSRLSSKAVELIVNFDEEEGGSFCWEKCETVLQTGDDRAGRGPNSEI